MSTRLARGVWLGVLLAGVAAAQADDAVPSALSSRPLNPASDQRITVLDQNEALRASQAAIGTRMPDVALRRRDGTPVRLRDYRGKPLLVSFLYTGCFQVCPTTTKNLQRALEQAVTRLGPQAFNVVSIGFNQPADSPEALKAFASQHGIHLPNWEFLSPAPALVPELTAAVGFRDGPTAAGFDHLNQLSLVDADGRLVRQIYGTAFDAEALVEPLRQLVDRQPLPALAAPRLSELIDTLILFCSRYDPVAGRYRVDYRIFLELAGLLTFVMAMAWFVWQERRHTRH